MPGARHGHAGAVRAHDSRTLITSVQRAFRALDAVGAHQNGAPARQLARETGLPLATALIGPTGAGRRARAGRQGRRRQRAARRPDRGRRLPRRIALTAVLRPPRGRPSG
ncbi:helix-turn-helix domain-containing protein [Streptomyces sp. NPDC003667]